MKAVLSLLAALGLLVAASAQAEKPGGAGKGSQPQVKSRADAGERAGGMAAQREQHHNRERLEQGYGAGGKNRHSADKPVRDERPGMEKQRELKQEQLRKEEDRGSEQGQASREEHSRKWWKFWE